MSETIVRLLTPKPSPSRVRVSGLSDDGITKFAEWRKLGSPAWFDARRVGLKLDAISG